MTNTMMPLPLSTMASSQRSRHSAEATGALKTVVSTHALLDCLVCFDITLFPCFRVQLGLWARIVPYGACTPQRKLQGKLVGAAGFEPTTTCAQGRCATRLRYAPKESKTTCAWPRIPRCARKSGPTRRCAPRSRPPSRRSRSPCATNCRA